MRRAPGLLLLVVTACAARTPPAAEPSGGYDTASAAEPEPDRDGEPGPPAAAPETPPTLATPLPASSAPELLAGSDHLAARAAVVATAVGQFEDNQALELPLRLDPGACYLFVATADGPGEVDLVLRMQQAPMPPVVLARDANAGPIATIGVDTCWKPPASLAGPATLVLHAHGGAGVAVVRAYTR